MPDWCCRYGAKTVDYDAGQEMVVVELTIGNKKNEKVAISSMLLMQVNNDWKCTTWARMNLPGGHESGFSRPTNFDVEIPAGDARKGTYLPGSEGCKGLASPYTDERDR